MANEPHLTTGHGENVIEVADETLTYRSIVIADYTPTGAQLAQAAGYKPAQPVIILRVLPSGELEDIRPDEVADIRQAPGRFIIVESDREFNFGIDGQRYSWPCQLITGAVVRKLGNIPAAQGIYLERVNEVDKLVADTDLVDLGARGMESFVSRKAVWKLNVQGVILEVASPTIVVSQALVEAGFDPNQDWHIFLKIAGHPKREVSATDVIDLREHGIEKLRLTPKNVNNGEAPPTPCRNFAVLDVDEQYLNKLGLRWETIIDVGRRWLIFHQFPVPPGYTVRAVTLALEIPPNYPGAQIDMFYTNPPLALTSGRPIECTHIAATINGVPFNGWSRHRGPGSEWNPANDNVVTHLALVESALAKEIGE